jgi:hypothetical protein
MIKPKTSEKDRKQIEETVKKESDQCFYAVYYQH